MYGCRGEARHVREQVAFGVVGEFVGPDQGQRRVDGGVDFGTQGVPDPADAKLPHVLDSNDADDRRAGSLDEGGVNGVHQPCPDLADGRAQDAEDREGDQQPDDRVGLASRARRRPHRAAPRGW